MPKILDACCGSRMFWFDKHNPYTTFMDIRKEYEELPTGHVIDVSLGIVLVTKLNEFTKKEAADHWLPQQ